MLICITGTPGSGKSTFARLLKSEAESISVLEINEIAKKYGAYSGRDADGTMIADMKKLDRAVKKELKRASGNNIAIVGHMAQELKIKPDICVTMRAKPTILYKRQVERGYTIEKIRENIVAEALDYCGEGAAMLCSNSFEVETKAEKGMIAKYIASLACGDKARGKALARKVEALRARRNMMPYFLRFIKENRISF